MRAVSRALFVSINLQYRQQGIKVDLCKGAVGLTFIRAESSWKVSEAPERAKSIGTYHEIAQRRLRPRARDREIGT
jgi:hypothetical protein